MEKAARLMRVAALTALMGAVLLGLAGPTAAQDGLSEGNIREPPPRDGEGVAPEREPVILEREELPDGSIHILAELPAVADTYIASNRPDQNFGNDALFLGYNLTGDNFGAERILVRFDVAGFLPPESVINSAELRLYLVFSSPFPDEPMGTVLRRSASPWNEYSVTWNLEPTWGEIRTSADVGDTEGFYSWDVTDLADDWLTGVHPNYGMEIIGDERIQQRERAFTPREAAENFPRLRVDYTVVDDDLPPIVTVDSLPDFSRRNFTVSWSGEDQGSAGIDHYDVQYRVDGGDWIDWQMDVTLTSAEFMDGENGRFYEFRARGVDTVGNVELFGDPEASTLVDTIPPTTTIDPLPPVTADDTFFVSWTGSDGGGSGIQYYDIRSRFNGGPWSLWLAETLSTGKTFTATQGDGVYEFEARAVDNAGQVEVFRGVAEASTAVDVVAPFIQDSVWVPVVIEAFTVGH